MDVASLVTSPVSYDVIIQPEQGLCRNYVLSYVTRMSDDRGMRLSGEHSYGLASTVLIRS